jgi:pimeloyl-ACP methyl ester carboxylesterase
VSLTVANGVCFHVQRLGQGPPLVMLHGLLLGSLAQWYFTAAPALAGRHGVLLYDLRGHGKSERTPDGYDLRTMARDLAALTADHRSEPLTLVGHSFGALIALRFALDFPGRVRKLVLVDAPLPPARFGEFSEFLRRSPAQMLEALPAPVRAALGRGGRRTDRWLHALGFLVGQSSLRADLEAEADIPDAELAQLQCETLCIYGADSACRPVGERLARVLPRARLTILAGGHYLPLQAPAALTRQIVEFVDG